MFKFNTETKILIGGGIITILVIVGISLFISKGEETSEIPKDQIVAQNGLHWHPKLEVYIKGEKQEFTDSIGLGAVHQKMHTHTEDYKDGVVHMEMSGVVAKDNTKLGNFFRIWGKEFSSSQIFEFKNSSTSAVKMMVNGKVNSEFANYHMRDGDMIEVRYE